MIRTEAKVGPLDRGVTDIVMTDFSELDQLYCSASVDRLREFYYRVGGIENLILFSRARPSPPMSVIIFPSRMESSIVAVVPTANSHSPPFTDFLASAKGLQVVAVESKGLHFNFARAMNLGIAYALELGPTKVVLSNDDVVLTRPAAELIQRFARSSARVAVPLVIYGSYRSNAQEVTIFRQGALFRAIIDAISRSSPRLLPRANRAHALVNQLPRELSKGAVPYFLLGRSVSSYDAPAHKARLGNFGGSMVEKFNTPLATVLNIQPFSVVDADLLRDYQFDETFINSGEDLDLALRLDRAGIKSSVIDFVVAARSGTSLGFSDVRLWRNTLFERLYMAYKLSATYHFPIGR